MNIGFIGCGNMASAIISGIAANENINIDKIVGYDVFEPALKKAENEYGITACSSENEVIENSNIVVLAVKPNVLSQVLNKINYILEKNDPLIISIAAGKSIDYLREQLTHDARIIRVMPNINAVVGEAICGYTANALATDEDKLNAQNIFSAIGKTIYLEESYFPLFGVLGGCSPAFAYMFIDALARAGVKNGMKKDVALYVAAQSLYGSAKMILESNEHPWELIDKVCSPGGTTIEGVTSLQSDGFEKSIHNAVDIALEKDSKL